MAAPDHGRRPNVVITGFSVFPGAPVNPTELLARAMAERAGEFADFCRLQSHVLPVEYGAIVRRLAEIARGFEPDIAIHFGLAAEARGFRIERTARNYADPALPDNAGICPGERLIAGGPPLFRGTLPADRIEAALSRAGIAAMQDDGAGAYL
jgi:pyroglutamyl-peptidase